MADPKEKAKEEKVPELIPSGIEGMDDILGGGLPKNATILLSGYAGSGKTTFGMQFLYYGAKKLNEPGVLISMELKPEDIIKHLKVFDWDLESVIKEKKLAILQTELYRFESLLTSIEDAVDKYNAKRLVIDSCTVLGLFFESRFKIRRSLLELARALKKKNCTTLLTNDIQEGSNFISSFGIEEFMVDGVILLNYKRVGSQYLRTVNVRKMRGVKHSGKIHPCEITPKGIVVYPSEVSLIE